MPVREVIERLQTHAEELGKIRQELAQAQKAVARLETQSDKWWPGFGVGVLVGAVFFLPVREFVVFTAFFVRSLFW